MKDHAKVGKRQGRPAYRTPSRFRAKKHAEVARIRREGKRGRSPRT